MDLYLLLAPLLLIPVVWLLRFVGCAAFSEEGDSAEDGDAGSGPIAKRINCGGPRVDADKAKGETLAWEADSATAGTAGFGEPNRPQVKDDKGALAGDVYETWRVGPGGTADLPYVLTLAQGDYKVRLKFARLDSNPNFGGKFEVQFNSQPPLLIDAALSVHPLAIKFDYPSSDKPGHLVHVDGSGQLTIAFRVHQQVGGGTFPFINAIQVRAST